MGGQCFDGRKVLSSALCFPFVEYELVTAEGLLLCCEQFAVLTCCLLEAEAVCKEVLVARKLIQSCVDREQVGKNSTFPFRACEKTWKLT